MKKYSMNYELLNDGHLRLIRIIAFSYWERIAEMEAR